MARDGPASAAGLIYRNQSHPHRGGLADLLGCSLGKHVTGALHFSGQVHLATVMGLRERLDTSVEALELKAWILF